MVIPHPGQLSRQLSRPRPVIKSLKQFPKMSLKIPDIIAKKRDGGCLTEDEIEFFVKGLTSGYVQDVQVGAWLMAVFLKGMTDEETSYLTRAMLHSGSIFRWPESIQPLIVDKHSTGGVGDKISLILAPALAACGLKVPMISGRGLGFTGGTIDKLESIPGFRALMSMEEAIEIIDTVGCFIMAQTEDLVPADKILYASRDISATVECMPLIAASIMSKKVAESPSTLLLDLKCGKAAFVRDYQTAKSFGLLMINVGRELGVKTAVAITKMDSPLGRKIGNALEVEESVDTLNGRGPEEVETLVCVQGGILLHLSGLVGTLEEGENLIRSTLHNGQAMKKFQDMLSAQGVSSHTILELCDAAGNYSCLAKAPYFTDIPYRGPPGIVESIDARELAVVSGQLGAARTKIGEPISFGVGLELLTPPSESITVVGKPWIRVHHDSATLSDQHVDRLQAALVVRQSVADTLVNGHHCSRVIEILY